MTFKGTGTPSNKRTVMSERWASNDVIVSVDYLVRDSQAVAQRENSVDNHRLRK